MRALADSMQSTKPAGGAENAVAAKGQENSGPRVCTHDPALRSSDRMLTIVKGQKRKGPVVSRPNVPPMDVRGDTDPGC